MDNDPTADGLDPEREGPDPFAQGVAAAANGGSLNDNRYEPGSDEHTAWEEGFMEKSREDGEDQPLLD